jgi:hypothetical protein
VRLVDEAAARMRTKQDDRRRLGARTTLTNVAAETIPLVLEMLDELLRD